MSAPVEDVLGEVARTYLSPTQRAIVLAVALKPGLSVKAVARIVNLTRETLVSKRAPGYLPFLEELELVERFESAIPDVGSCVRLGRRFAEGGPR